MIDEIIGAVEAACPTHAIAFERTGDDTFTLYASRTTYHMAVSVSGSDASEVVAPLTKAANVRGVHPDEQALRFTLHALDLTPVRDRIRGVWMGTGGREVSLELVGGGAARLSVERAVDDPEEPL